jgi:hypothetical protein
MVKNAGIQVTESLHTGHSPFLSKPEETANFIRWVIEEHPGSVADPINS